jgi:LmbE family N-acetylglucosaminyl deacetylase
MELVVDARHLGRSEREWASSQSLQSLPALGPLRARRIIVVAPHPDDEIFGAGGLLQAVRAQGTPVEFVAVTDGEASHPRASPSERDELRHIRQQESAVGLRRLGWEAPAVTRLGLPDGQLGRHVADVARGLAEQLRPDDLVLAPWWHDGHPDHDACGRAARTAGAASGVGVLGYLVWAWHWCDPDAADIPWDQCRRFELNRRMAARKRWASGAFVSQTKPFGPGSERAPVLPSPLLRRFWRRFEVFVDGRIAGP